MEYKKVIRLILWLLIGVLMNPVIIGNGRLYCCDVRDGLTELADESIDCVVTSPPYWNLRDYGVEGQIGLETDYQEYVDNLVGIFNAIKPKLKQTATVWVNISDTYSRSGGSGNQAKNRKLENKAKAHFAKGISGKSLVGVPFRFANQMIDSGWTLRNTIIWQKPNAMPCSVKDRFTVDHEYIFFFTINKEYYFKQLFEPIKESSRQRAKYDFRQDVKTESMKGLSIYGYDPDRHPGRNKRTVWTISTKSYFGKHIAAFPIEIALLPIMCGCPEGGVVLDPFIGSGTTAVAAERQKCTWVGIDIAADSEIETRARIKNENEKRTVQFERG